MTLTCDPPRVFGDVEIIAVAARRTVARRFAHAAFVCGEKRPVAVVIREGEKVWAFDGAGGATDLAELARLCPDLRARLQTGAGA